MTKDDVFEFINRNPVFHLGTVDNGQPRVRGMLTYSATDDGIIFHTGNMRNVYRQIEANPLVELCYNDYEMQMQVRVSGTLHQIKDNAFKDQVADHPSRTFLTGWRNAIGVESFHTQFIVYCLKRGIATCWQISDNFAPKNPHRPVIHRLTIPSPKKDENHFLPCQIVQSFHMEFRGFTVQKIKKNINVAK
ncbi:MAG: pyridoxamine 5'-phosphate oxidase family protein [Deltaproteobacteria bacterium]|nr:pyridoxamine 5'-phosphate oxidase family protein [Deltaproteobacteria bacterium]